MISGFTVQVISFIGSCQFYINRQSSYGHLNLSCLLIRIPIHSLLTSFYRETRHVLLCSGPAIHYTWQGIRHFCTLYFYSVDFFYTCWVFGSCVGFKSCFRVCWKSTNFTVVRNRNIMLFRLFVHLDWFSIFHFHFFCYILNNLSHALKFTFKQFKFLSSVWRT